MAISKVNFGDETLIDLTADTVTPETLFEGVTAHSADGTPITGTFSMTSILEKQMPVGYIFQWNRITGSDIDLSTSQKVHDYYGFGTWAQIKDRFILAAGDEYPIGPDGGEAEVTLTEAEMPSHSHKALDYLWVGFSSSSYATALVNTGSGTNSYQGTAKTGGGQPHNNMPPYRVAYTWQRVG